MSMIPYWLRHLRNVAARDPVIRAFEDPFAAFSKDSFLRDPGNFVKSITSPTDHVEGVFSDSEIKIDGRKVEVYLDVQNFTPEQINVKTIGNEVIVVGKKEIKRETGWTKSHFERRFLLPEGFPPERVECHLDRGRLVVVAFRSKPLNERNVPIREQSDEPETCKKD